MTSPVSQRLDLLLVKEGAYPTRARAQEAIKAGLVRIDGAVVDKPAAKIPPDAMIDAAGDVHDYVSRGALKLEAGLDQFGLDCAGAAALDLGASTGGFTELLLRRGAAKVYAVDVGTEQLHPSLKEDRRVVNLEKTHARDLTRSLIPDEIDFLVCDVSFISLKKALPPALALCGCGARLAALVKPQFEVGRARIGKGGLVRPGRDNAEGMAEDIIDWLKKEQGWRPLGYCESPIAGGGGAREFLIAAAKDA